MAVYNNGLAVEIIEGIEVYRIDDYSVSGGYDVIDGSGEVDVDAARKRKASGWWGNQNFNDSDFLNSTHLKRTLETKSSCKQLDSPGVYMYINRDNEKKYIGSACDQSIFERQKQHLISASRSKQQVGKFHAVLSEPKNYIAANWDFIAIPMQGADPQEILEKERELILKHKSLFGKYGYNTQLPGGR